MQRQRCRAGGNKSESLARPFPKTIGQDKRLFRFFVFTKTTRTTKSLAHHQRDCIWRKKKSLKTDRKELEESQENERMDVATCDEEEDASEARDHMKLKYRIVGSFLNKGSSCSDVDFPISFRRESLG